MMNGPKQPVTINFAQGLDTKTDPKQVQVGKFRVLRNSIFNKGGLLQKRNGYAQLSALPDASSSYTTTFNGNLTAIGSSIEAYNQDSESWVSKGSYLPLKVSTLPLIRNSLNQTQCDAAIAPNGLICTVYAELNNSTTTYKYAVAVSETGQNIIAPTAIPVSTGAVTGNARVFVLGNYFVIVFTNTISATPHLQYIAVSITNPTVVTTNADIASAYVPKTGLSWDGVVVNSNLYIAYNTTTGGQAIKVTYLSSAHASVGGAPIAAVTFAGQIATIVSLCADLTNPQSPIIYVNYYDGAGQTGHSLAVDSNLHTILAPTLTIASGVFVNIASAAQNGSCSIFVENTNAYSYDSGIPTNLIVGTAITQAGVVTTPYNLIRSVGLASKAFIVGGTVYFFAAFQSPFQPTYVLINGTVSTQSDPVVVGKLAYENGGGYLTHGLPAVTITDGTMARVPYLFKDLVQALTTVGDSTQSTVGGIYSQTGINLSSWDFRAKNIDAVEIGNNLNISGGFGWMYDGYLPVEQNFLLWPDSVEATWSATGGAIAAQPDGATNTNAYFYQAVYEWSDNQGNIFRSAPSVPIPVTTTGSGVIGSITVNVPTLRLTRKIANPLKIVIYRWSIAEQIYHQVTSITAPTLNSTIADSVAFIDTLADASIIGNSIIYTNGGVVEDVNPPASNIMTLFDTRAWLVDAEDPNLLWFSKQIIENTPVEWSDLFTFFVAPTTAAQGSTGPITALAPMDDKLIIFKQSNAGNAIYYINGIGPDNTGANNQYSQPIFITSTVGCANQQSIVFMPQGLMFQSDKGIWLLGRDLSTKYIGAPVEEFNLSLVQSAVNVPATNQVRFTLDTGQTLMYDYYYEQWGAFVGAPAISSTIYQGLHTYISPTGLVAQESPNQYLDNGNPVLINFKTGPIWLAGITGFQRAIELIILGQYVSPHKLVITIDFDFGKFSQAYIVEPTNSTGVYGSDSLYGQTSPFGGPGDLEEWRIQFDTQQCQSIEVTLQEFYDPSFDQPAGAGFTMSSMTLWIIQKKSIRPFSANQTVG